jgi:hypothetical protein
MVLKRLYRVAVTLSVCVFFGLSGSVLRSNACVSAGEDAGSSTVSTTTINLPGGSLTEGIAFEMAFVYSGSVGLVPAIAQDGSSALYAFSMSNGQVIGTFDLTADFGLFPTPTRQTSGLGSYEYLQSFDSLGLVAVYGQDGSTANQKVVMFQCGTAGALSRLWSQTFPALSNPPATPVVQFNADGSRLYTYYYTTTQSSGGISTRSRHTEGALIEGGDPQSLSRGTALPRRSLW